MLETKIPQPKLWDFLFLRNVSLGITPSSYLFYLCLHTILHMELLSQGDIMWLIVIHQNTLMRLRSAGQRTIIPPMMCSKW